MSLKRIALFAIALLAVGSLLAVYLSGNIRPAELDAAAANDIVKTISAQWTDVLENGELPRPAAEIDYTVMDDTGSPVAATRDGLSRTLNDAARNYDAVLDVKMDGEVVGKVVFHNDSNEELIAYRDTMMAVCIAVLAAAAAFFIVYAYYLNRTVSQPFRNLERFAAGVAAGNLDMPLKMDKGNVFGAFTESFDLMREELKKSREEERRANESKKELVASLSHDILTPVASIKAVSELAALQAQDEKMRERAEVIGAKAEQIHVLVTDMFHATMEELQKLRVEPSELSSQALPAMLQEADYQHRVQMTPLPDCILWADAARLRQVMDNLTGNSYKYANTAIEVSGYMEDGCLVLELKDFGRGVDAEDVPLLFNKYFRGKNTQGKDGYGLGLFISKYLMQQMGGDLQCESDEGGFTARIILRLADENI